MRVLVDTHALLWWLFDDPRLPKAARAAIADPGNDVLVSAASAWEISTKRRIGKLPEAGDVPDRLAAYVAKAGFTPLAVTLDHGLAAGALDGDHRDPFDRMLAAQALAEQVPLVSGDAAFAGWGVPVVW